MSGLAIWPSAENIYSLYFGLISIFILINFVGKDRSEHNLCTAISVYVLLRTMNLEMLKSCTTHCVILTKLSKKGQGTSI
jgi:hypothetical protein